VVVGFLLLLRGDEVPDFYQQLLWCFFGWMAFFVILHIGLTISVINMNYEYQ
jgi:hypothetical protein